VTPTSQTERLFTITSVLSVAGPDGRSAKALVETVGYGGTDESRRESLKRDIRHLNRTGISIENVAAPGSDAQYVMHLRDSRIPMTLTEEQQLELSRAALLAGAPELVAQFESTDSAEQPGNVTVKSDSAGPELDQLLRSVTARCRLEFLYNGKPRVVLPYFVEPGSFGWTVTGLEVAEDRVKTFSQSRMSEVELGPVGSAEAPEAARRPSRDPLEWHVDPAEVATLEAPRRFAGEVADLLHARIESTEFEVATLSATVHNRVLFLARVMELGTRVTLVGPDSLRQQLGAHLHEVIDG